jgi:hypothetical protein
MEKRLEKKPFSVGEVGGDKVSHEELGGAKRGYLIKKHQ